MAEITRILAANIRRQFFCVVTTTASTLYLAQNFQLIVGIAPAIPLKHYKPKIRVSLFLERMGVCTLQGDWRGNHRAT